MKEQQVLSVEQMFEEGALAIWHGEGGHIIMWESAYDYHLWIAERVAPDRYRLIDHARIDAYTDGYSDIADYDTPEEASEMAFTMLREWLAQRSEQS